METGWICSKNFKENKIMAVSQIDAAANLGKLLQIVYSNGVINQISEDFRDWDAVSKIRVSEEAARSVNFMLQSGYGPSAVGWSKQGSLSAFKNPQQSNVGEKSAGFNQIQSTVELEYDVWDRAMSAPHKFAEPLALEINNKSIAQKRMLSSDFHRDGSGLLGITSSTAATRVTLPDSSFAMRVSYAGVSSSDGTDYAGGGSRYAEYQDKHVFAILDGSVDALGASVSYGVVDSKNRQNDTVDYKLYTSSDVELAGAAYTTAAAACVSQFMYRENQPTRADLTAGIATLGELNNLTEVIPGLESLFANDGRTMHGITMRGATAGTQYDAGANPLDISQLDEAISQLKVIVGQGKYKYNQILCSPEARSALIDSQEQDRRLQALSDDKRGFKGFGYVHDNDTLELATSEFCKKSAMWIMPQGGKDKGCIELHGKDFKNVSVGSQDTFLKPSSSGGHEPLIRKYMNGYLTLLTKHPASALKIKNFTV
jgi:hypothetical protein